MTCQEIQSSIEPIAAGHLEVSAAARAHLESCPRCAASLASARRVEAALRGLAAPAAPPGFTAAVIARVRRERWVTEQRVDRLFNLGIAAAVLLLAAGVLSFTNIAGVLAIASWTAAGVGGLASQTARQVAPTLGLYAGAASLLVTALAMWWWAERGAW